jgi:hypothetical protein
MTEKQVEVSYSFYNVPGYKQTVIKDIVDKNIDGKLDAYLKKIYTKQDAEVRLNYKIQKTNNEDMKLNFYLIVMDKYLLIVVKSDLNMLKIW